MIERMTLSKLRACIRAGAYRDDLTSQEEGSCAFSAGWYGRAGWMNGRWQRMSGRKHRERPACARTAGKAGEAEEPGV